MDDNNSQDSTVNNPQNFKTTKVVYPQIYSYTLPEIKANEGLAKNRLYRKARC
jgi:hypothetical protein